MKKLLILALFLTISLNAKIIFAVIPLEDKDTMLEQFSSLAYYLSEELGKKVVIKVGSSYQNVENGLMSGKYTIAYLGPIGVIKAMMKNRSVIPLVKIKRGKSTTYKSVIVVKKNSKINSLTDLKNKKFAFGDRLSTSSHYVPKNMLKMAGVPIKVFKKILYTGSHSNVVRAILGGKADAGGIKESVFKKHEKELKILKTSSKIPGFTIAANLKKISRERVSKLKKAFLKLNNSDITKPIDRKITGFARAYKSEYLKLSYLLN